MIIKKLYCLEQPLLTLLCLNLLIQQFLPWLIQSSLSSVFCICLNKVQMANTEVSWVGQSTSPPDTWAGFGMCPASSGPCWNGSKERITSPNFQNWTELPRLISSSQSMSVHQSPQLFLLSSHFPITLSNTPVPPGLSCYGSLDCFHHRARTRTGCISNVDFSPLCVPYRSRVLPSQTTSVAAGRAVMIASSPCQQATQPDSCLKKKQDTQALQLCGLQIARHLIQICRQSQDYHLWFPINTTANEQRGRS